MSSPVGYVNGQEFEVRAPFVWYQTDIPEPDGPGFVTVETWKPGFDAESDEYNTYYLCHGFGQIIYTIIDFHKLPRPYPARVFYTRKFRDPDGKVFGKSKLRITTTAHFTRMIKSHCWPFSDRLDDVEQIEKPTFTPVVAPDKR